jgi:pimeloyl-ACP methyl ester carboxylesterase
MMKRSLKAFACAAFIVALPSCTAQQEATQLGEWSVCESSDSQLQCSTLTVPRFHESDESETVLLRVVRSPKVDQAKAIGTLVVHAGGPGVQHELVLESIRAFLGSGFDQWDIVALDTRGTRNSHPFDCNVDLLRLMEEQDGCDADKYFDASWSTAESVEDLQTLRDALGEERVRFLGWSYGGTLGAAWLAKYPNSVEKMVLDAPGDPNIAWSDYLAARFAAMNKLAPQILEDRPVPQDKRTQFALEMAMYDPELWEDFRRGYDGDDVAIDSLVSRRLGITEQGSDGGINAQIAVRCSDLSAEELAKVMQTSVSATSGIGLAIESACARFVLSAPIYRKPLGNASQVPVLVTATRGDVASPFDLVTQIASSLQAEFLEIQGSRHTSIGSDPTATKGAIEFLLD